MYSYDWYDRQTGDVNGRASVSDEVNPIVPQFLLCVDLPYGCTGGGVLAEVDERAGTLKVRARSLADVGVPLEVGRNRALGNIGRANAVIDDVITLSAPATLTLRGHLAGSVERSLDYRPDVEFGASANFWRWREDLTNTEEPWIRENVGGYANGLNSSGTIDELFIVPVELPAGETNFSAFMKAYTYALSGASRTSETEFESSSMYASVRFDNTFGFEILVPAGVVATSASGLLPFTQDTTGQVPEPSALALLGLGLAGLAAARRRRQ